MAMLRGRGDAGTGRRGDSPSRRVPASPRRRVPASLCPRVPASPIGLPYVVAGLLLAAAGCASYHIGNDSLYPKDIHTVYVPIFESASFRPDLGERLTEAVVKRIEEVTPLKVVNSAGDADSVLIGQILGDAKHVLFANNYNDTRELQVELQVRVHWEDRHGNTLRQCPPVPVPPDLIAVTGTATMVPEVGQSYATSSQQAIEQVAKQIVGLMEAPW